MGNSYPSLFFFLRKCVVNLKLVLFRKNTHTQKQKRQETKFIQRGCESWRDFYRHRKQGERNKLTIRSTSFVRFHILQQMCLKITPLPLPHSTPTLLPTLFPPPTPSPIFSYSPVNPLWWLRDKTSTKLVCCGCELNIVV